MITDESFDLRVELVVAPDQAQIFEQLASEEGNHRTIIRRPAAVELNNVIDFGIEHGFENDIASLFRREGLDG